MEVHLRPEIATELIERAAQSGRPADELAEGAIAIYAGEPARVRDMLNRRYDDLKSGKVKLIPGDEASARFHQRIEARRNRPA